MRALLLPALLLVSPILSAMPFGGGDAWLSSFADAKARAKKESKDLLLDFTGSDWCSWCQKLHSETLDKEPFLTAVKKSFVLLELDFPRGKKLDAKLTAQNDELAARFGVTGYPTLLLCDADGKPYAKTGYQKDYVGPEKYLAHLNELKQKHTARDAALEQAKNAQGAERAKALAGVFDSLEPNYRLSYADLVEEIIGLDGDGKAGLRDKYTKIKGDLDAETKQIQLWVKGKGLAETDKKAAIDTLQQAIAAAPATALATKRIPGFLATIDKSKKKGK